MKYNRFDRKDVDKIDDDKCKSVPRTFNNTGVLYLCKCDRRKASCSYSMFQGDHFRGILYTDFNGLSCFFMMNCFDKNVLYIHV